MIHFSGLPDPTLWDFYDYCLFLGIYVLVMMWVLGGEEGGK